MIELTDSSENDEPSATTSNFQGVQFSTRIIPAAKAAFGADWCEVLTLSDEVVGLSIGDVCGHGRDQFATMVTLRQAIRDAAFDGCNPAQILARANTAFCDHRPNDTATAIFAQIDTRARTVTFANAGHPPPLMVGPFGNVFIDFPERDVPFGVQHLIAPVLHTLHAPPATLFIFYTDGVTERERYSSQGPAELALAAHVAYRLPNMPAARIIEEQMLLTGSNRDDASILTAWTPWLPIARKAASRHKIDKHWASMACAAGYRATPM